MSKSYNVAVVGATGMVGRKMLEVLQERKLPIANFYAFASARSAGSQIAFNGKNYTVIELTPENITAQPLDFAIFSAGGGTSRDFAPLFAKAGCIVVDNSSQWRMDPSVPLVVPEVNPDALKKHNNIIANPNCSTIQAVVALAPAEDPEIAVALLVVQGGLSSSVTPIAREIIGDWFDLKEARVAAGVQDMDWDVFFKMNGEEREGLASSVSAIRPEDAPRLADPKTERIQ